MESRLWTINLKPCQGLGQYWICCWPNRDTISTKEDFELWLKKNTQPFSVMDTFQSSIMGYSNIFIKAWPEARLINFLHTQRWCDDTYNFAVLSTKQRDEWCIIVVFLSSNFFMLKWMTCQKLIFCVGLCVIKIAWTLNSSVWKM